MVGPNSREAAFDKIEQTVQSGGDLAHFERDSSSNKVIVVFSHVDIPKGKFAQSRAVRDIPGSKLFLNCLENQWYTKGVHKFSSDIPSTVGNILKMIQGFDPVFIGHSMGAYLSLICGNHLERSKFVSTSPELHLGLKGSRSYRNNVRGKPAWWNIEELRSKFHGSPNGVTLFGAYDPIDCFFLSEPEKLEGLGRVYEVPHHHGVTEYMTSHKMYDRFLTGVSDDNRDESYFLTREHFAPVGTSGQPEQYRHFYDAFWLFSNSRSDLPALRDVVSKYSDWINPGWQELRSKIFYVLGENANSMAAASAAFAYQPNLMQFIDTYANSCIRMNEVKRLSDLIDSMNLEQRAHNVGKRVVERVHEKFGHLYRLPLDSVEDLEVGTPTPSEEVVEATTVERPAYPFETYSRTETEMTLPASTEFQASLTSRDYDHILDGTQIIHADHYIDHPASVMCRALALLWEGDTAASVRSLRAVIGVLKPDRRTARICLDIGVQTRNNDLIVHYLNMDLSNKIRKLHAGRLMRALDFVSDPELATRIIVEILQHGSELDEHFDRLHRRSKRHGTLTHLIKLIESSLDDIDIKHENRQSLALLLSRSGLRSTALSILGNVRAEHASPRDQKPDPVLDVISAYLPTAKDYLPQELDEEETV